MKYWKYKTIGRWREKTDNIHYDMERLKKYCDDILNMNWRKHWDKADAFEDLLRKLVNSDMIKEHFREEDEMFWKMFDRGGSASTSDWNESREKRIGQLR